MGFLSLCVCLKLAAGKKVWCSIFFYDDCFHFHLQSAISKPQDHNIVVGQKLWPGAFKFSALAVFTLTKMLFLHHGCLTCSNDLFYLTIFLSLVLKNKSALFWVRCFLVGFQPLRNVLEWGKRYSCIAWPGLDLIF